MPALSPTATSLGLIGCGLAVCLLAGKPLVHDASLQVPPNPLGIKMSPYGEVFAMAMQGPIDLYWHAGSEDECHDPNCDHEDHSHQHGSDSDHEEHADHEHCDHGPECTHDHREADPTLATSLPKQAPRSLRDQYRSFLEGIDATVQARTNPRGASPSHKFYLRRKIEDKLRFAWQLDPSHYGNYSSYHFFITEPAVGTRPELTQGAQRLADATIAYCLYQDSDPRPALTAAAAAQNVLELMIADRERHSTSAMRERLAQVDHCLARYHVLHRQAVQSGQWDLVSPFRQAETEERCRFLTRIRDAAEVTIRRFEGQPPPQQASTS